jgi:uncharacterized SAM-binding protein YcdF (DUF218 family)
VFRKPRFLLLLLIVLISLGAVGGRLLVVDHPTKADIILVLAGETNRRPLRGLELLKQGYGRQMILDVPASARIYQWTQLELAQNYINQIGQAKPVEICPIAGLSTRDEARDTISCLQHMEGKDVLLVTSDYHSRRALEIFRHEVRGYNFNVAAAYDDSEFGTAWWRRREWAKTAVSEWAKLAWWEAADRWRSPVTPQSN